MTRNPHIYNYDYDYDSQAEGLLERLLLTLELELRAVDAVGEREGALDLQGWVGCSSEREREGE